MRLVVYPNSRAQELRKTCPQDTSVLANGPFPQLEKKKNNKETTKKKKKKKKNGRSQHEKTKN